jgi:hypothetical protein
MTTVRKGRCDWVGHPRVEEYLIDTPPPPLSSFVDMMVMLYLSMGPFFPFFVFTGYGLGCVMCVYREIWIGGYYDKFELCCFCCPCCCCPYF